jgi:hypothetical protein
MRPFRPRLTYANVASTIALLIAVSMGSAYAAGGLAPRSVGESQLRPGAVTADKLRKNAVTAPKLKAQAVKQGKLAEGAVTGEKIAGGVITGSKIAGGAVTPDKIPNDSLTGEKIIESSLGQVPSANNANMATVAITANPEAFAKVNAEGTVFPGDSKGIGTADVTLGKTFAGIYCITVPFSPKGAQVTPIYMSHNSVTAYVRVGGTENCSASQVEVQTFNAGTHQQEPFYIIFYH